MNLLWFCSPPFPCLLLLQGLSSESTQLPFSSLSHIGSAEKKEDLYKDFGPYLFWCKEFRNENHTAFNFKWNSLKFKRSFWLNSHNFEKNKSGISHSTLVSGQAESPQRYVILAEAACDTNIPGNRRLQEKQAHLFPVLFAITGFSH